MMRPTELELNLRATLIDRAGDIPEDPSPPFDPGVVTRFSGRPVDGGPSSGHRRWVRVVTVAAAAVVLIAGIATAVGRNGPVDRVVGVAADPADTSAADGRAVRVVPVGLDSLDGLFVATSAEYNGPTLADSWPVFSTRVRQAGFGRCLVDDDQTFTPAGDSAAWSTGSVRNNTQFPDLAKLQAGTFTDGVDNPEGADAGSGGTGRAGAAPDCDAGTVARARAVAEATDAWTERWGAAIAGIDADPDVVAARSDYVSCMDDRGIEVVAGGSGGVVAGDVFSLADDAERDGDTARVAELAESYGVCIAPVSDAMDDFRLAKRAGFYREHAADLEQLARDIDDVESRLAAAYGLAHPHPRPS